MIVTAADVADFDQFLRTFATRGSDKRREHGCRGAWLFRDPRDPTCVWSVFDWDAEDYERFLADPEVPAIARELGLHGAPSHPELIAELDA